MSPRPLPDHPYVISEKVARAVKAVLPPGFRGVLRIVVDSNGPLPHDVTVEFRPPQPHQARMAG
jgi:hypothetical protein